MDRLAWLQEFLDAQYAPAAPKAGDVAEIEVAGDDRQPSGHVSCDADGVAHVTVRAGADLARRMADYCSVTLVRSMGGAVIDRAAVDAARAQMGDAEFDEQLAGMVATALAGSVLARAGVRPFLNPEVADAHLPVDGEDYELRSTALIMPRCELSSYGPAQVGALVPTEVTPAQVEERAMLIATRIMGPGTTKDSVGPERWSQAMQVAERSLRQEAAEFDAQRMSDACADDLATRLVTPIPAAFKEPMRDYLTGLFVQDLIDQGIDLQEYEKSGEFNEREFKMRMALDANDQLRRAFALEAVAARQGIEVTVEDMRVQAAQGRMEYADQAVFGVRQSGMLTRLLTDAILAKTSRFVVDNALVTEVA